MNTMTSRLLAAAALRMGGAAMAAQPTQPPIADLPGAILPPTMPWSGASEQLVVGNASYRASCAWQEC